MTKGLKNKDGFKKLYKETYGPLVNYAYSKTKDWELSKEIVQNTFVRFWNKRNDINIRTSVKNYLFSMVRNGIIDYYRKEKNTVEIEEIQNNKHISIEQDEISIQNEYKFKYGLKKAIGALKEKRRRIFELSKFEGLTYKEIADYLNISERTVEDNIAKAFKEIRNYFYTNNLI